MKKKRFFWMIYFLVVIMALSFFNINVQIAHAAPEMTMPNAGDTEAAQNVSVQLFAEPQSLKLPRNSTSFWFRIPDGTKLGNRSSLSLAIAAADTLIDDYSTVTLLLGNTQIATAHILEIVKNHEGMWTVPIPAEHLKTDGTLNELRIVTAQRTILGDCADIDNPANWVRLERNSRLNLDVLQMGNPTLGTALTYLFDRVNQHNQTNAEFILSSGSDNNIRSAMLTAASAIGAAYPAKDTVRFSVSQGSSAGEEHNRIYIGQGSQKPQGIADIPSLSEGLGYLAISKNGVYNDLSVFGADAAGLAKAAAFFTHFDYLAQLSGSSAVISTDLQGVGTGFVKNEDGYYTLSDFGYDTVNLAGAFHQEVNYTLKQPQAVRSGADSYVEIHFRHSKALVGDTSLLTVHINGVAVSSIQLSDSNAEGGSIRVRIPAEALDKSSINIKVECYNYLGKLDCSKDYYDTAWTVIDKASVVYFQPGDASIPPAVQPFPTFDDVAGEVWPTAILCIPENASQTMVEVAAGLVCRSGQNSGAFRWEYANNLNSAQRKSADILILGTNDNVVIPAEVANLLSAVPHKEGFSVSGSTVISEEALQNKIVIQVVRSPWNFYRKVYVVTCPPDMVYVLKQFISERKELGKLGGTIALIDENKTVTVNSDDSAIAVMGTIGSKASEKLPFSLDRFLGKIVRATGVSRGGLLVITVCVLLILFLIVKVSQNRRRFEDAKKKMEEVNKDAGKHASEESVDPDDFDHDINDR